MDSMNFAKHSTSRLLGLALVLNMWPLTSAGFQTPVEQSAPTPGDSYRIPSGELKAIEGSAAAGNVPSIHRLADYYILYVGDDAKGVLWLERLGDSGDLQARSVVLYYFQHHPSAGTSRHLDKLRKRWNVQ